MYMKFDFWSQKIGLALQHRKRKPLPHIVKSASSLTSLDENNTWYLNLGCVSHAVSKIGIIGEGLVTKDWLVMSCWNSLELGQD